MIDYYQDIYHDEIVIDELINKLKQGQFDNLSIIDLNRFRIFLDAVLLTFNNEKVYNAYLKDKFAFQPFFDRLNDSKLFIRERPFLENHKKYLNNLFKIRINKFDSFFYSLDGEDRRVWDQFKIVRNAYSHMKYCDVYFEDKFNHRSELLEVPEESLLRFINQDIFKIR
ncbi:MAG: hypothetical protein E6871_00450 [Streptococcus anginosus]|uniref:hypothetical protein n=1 Tax=Streptococcus anginosus TaxID=1328 RepID=UPI0021F851BD|nr:hypothetical protein [Streptococcus anginosus]MCW0988889.1 hypothetical protein [Streptococcus anginosus]MCW0992497.1 hypothetical protein [Streptococcus anginosus]MCW1023470.1 hypothetical protein [Streptococcus anginosus]MDU1590092.1 hypothetical protein [Streptococcus anginosus]MDU1636971.1 hypothetical protein [Streptococcus anginosus]